MKKRGSAKEHVPTKEEFEKLLDACELTEEPSEYRFFVLVMGIIGMRIGEIGHMKENWVDSEREKITIPRHEPCRCKYCKKQLKKSRSPQEKLKKYWSPKTKAGARSIPFGFNHEVREILKEVIPKYKGSPFDTRQIEVRFRYLAELAGLSHIHPHALRAYAVTNFAYAGINAATLQTIMGWTDIETAMKYIARSGALAEKEFERVFGKKRESVSDFHSRRVFYMMELGKKLMERKQLDDDEERLRNLITQLQSDRTQRQLSPVEISKLHYKIYELLTKKHMYKSQVKNELKLADFELNRSIKILKSLVLIKAINPNNIPIFYRGTHITPIVSP